MCNFLSQPTARKHGALTFFLLWSKMLIKAVISVSTLGFSSALKSSFNYCPFEKFQILTVPSAADVINLLDFISNVPVVIFTF